MTHRTCQVEVSIALKCNSQSRFTISHTVEDGGDGYERTVATTIAEVLCALQGDRFDISPIILDYEACRSNGREPEHERLIERIAYVMDLWDGEDDLNEAFTILVDPAKIVHHGFAREYPVFAPFSCRT